MDETMSGEAMALYVTHKINNKLKFLYRKIDFLKLTLRCLHCNALTQPHFDYACSAWYPNLSKKSKHIKVLMQILLTRFQMPLIMLHL